MQVAVISDMHGNAVALDAVLADLAAHPADQVVCLGDAIQGGPQPAAVVARLRELGCPVVMGNADAWLLSGQVTGPGETVSAQQEAVRAWSLAQLTDADRAFIAGFAPTVSIPLDDGRRLLCFHGSPASFDEVILPETPEAEVQRMLGPFVPAILTGGHTHLQQVRRLGSSFFFNPGSAGRAYDRHQADTGFRVDPWAEYAVLTSEGARLALEFRRVPFAIAALTAAYATSGHPFAAGAIAQYE